MGEDKALKPFLGQRLIQRVIDRVTTVADEVIVTTNRPAEYGFLNLRLVSDLKPGRGALGGLYTAVASATFPLVAVVACDMPFASSSLLEGARRLMVEEKADVVIARTDKGYEPLHALYRREACLPAIEAAIEADQWKVTSWLPHVNVRILTVDEAAAFDPSGLCFRNINTPEEFSAAEHLARQTG
jgi:molybdenum cofactor guanylyltransferase